MPNVMNLYAWQPGMAEISGYGEEGDPQGVAYEETCRAMVRRGMQWMDAHPDADPCFGSDGTKNSDAIEFSQALVDGSQDEATGAMFTKTAEICLWAKENGWDAYVALMRRSD